MVAWGFQQMCLTVKLQLILLVLNTLVPKIEERSFLKFENGAMHDILHFIVYHLKAKVDFLIL